VLTSHRDPRVETVFVGRDAEVERLVDLAWTAHRRRATIAVELVGAAGVGKSRLVDTVIAQVSAELPDAPVVMRGLCPAGELRPLGLFVDLVDRLSAGRPLQLWRRLLQSTRSASIADRLKRARPGFEWLRDGAGGQDPDENTLLAAQSALTAAVAALTSGTNPGPLVLALDDVQWLDAASKQVGLALLGTRPPGGTLVVLARRKSGSIPGRWRSRLRLERIDLEALGDTDAVQLAGALIGATPDDATGTAIAHAAAGNPFIVEQIASFALDVRELSAASRASTMAERLADLGTGDPARIVAARLDCLPAATRAVVQVCAIAGDHTPLAVIDKVLDAVPSAATSSARAIDHACRRGLLYVSESPDRRVAFNHALIRMVAANDVTDGTLEDLHRATADALQEHFRDNLRPWLATIADHYHSAGDVAEALRWSLHAGRYALGLSSFAEARRDLRRAVELATDIHQNDSLSLALASLAGVQLAQGDCADAVQTCTRALATCAEPAVRIQLMHTHARALMELQKTAEATDVLDQAEALAAQGIDDAASTDDVVARLHMLRARILRHGLDVEGTIDRLQRADKLLAADRHGPRSEILLEMTYTAAQAADSRIMAQTCERMIAFAKTAPIGPRATVLGAIGLLTSAHAGDLRRSRDAYDEAARLHAETGEHNRLLDARIGGVIARAYRGELVEAARMRTGIIELARHVDVARHAINMNLAFSLLGLHRGEYDKALRAIREAVGRIEQLDAALARHDGVIFRYLEGQALCGLGRTDEGLDVLERSVDYWYRSNTLLLYRPEGDLALAETYIDLGRHDDATAPLARADTTLRDIPNAQYRSWAHSLHAAIARHRGDLIQASRRVDAALQDAKRADSSYQQWRAMVQQAENLVATSHPSASVVVRAGLAATNAGHARGLAGRFWALQQQLKA